MQQSVIYDDQKAVEKALQKLESLPPLVSPTEVNCSWGFAVFRMTYTLL